MHGPIEKSESSKKTQRVRVEEHQDRPRFFLPPRNEFDDVWSVVRHKKFHKPLNRTQKRRLLRERVAAKREIAGMMVSKYTFYRKATEDKSSEYGDDLLSEDDTRENKTIDFRVGIHIPVDLNTDVMILTEKFKLWNVMKKRQ
ncbi:hypothetical protein F511_34201 [Dorcoceras hygrometricum]|uniref:Uncharacterized protein n=1 Tax=Dorcoceras hygrometricum TaxID=472368 RepID=A0A2Z7CPA3_9LAMI|nr:hypothetical protein F511_34201 [Dorcoceras hygrometricum]